jgi:Swiss Army Knife RNA repair-like protein
MSKPILFHDIDGVLFGHYGPENHFQLRPGLGDWLNWVHEHFEVVWLTTWRRDQIEDLLTLIWPRTSTYIRLQAPAAIHVADWYSYLSKEAWIKDNVACRPYIDWYWIDDMVGRDPFDQTGLPAQRCLWVNPDGEHALDKVRLQLDEVRKTLAAR